MYLDTLFLLIGAFGPITFKVSIVMCGFDLVIMKLAGYFAEFLCGCFLVSLAFVLHGILVGAGDGLSFPYLVLLSGVLVRQICW